MRPRCPRSFLLLALVVPLAVAACGSATDPVEHATARFRWAQRGPADYRVTIRRSCGECLPSMMEPVIVTVEDRVVTSRTYAATGAPVPDDLADVFPSVEQLLARIDEWRRRPVARLDVRYDRALGLPVEVAVDVDAEAVDDEFAYTLTDLQPR